MEPRASNWFKPIACKTCEAGLSPFDEQAEPEETAMPISSSNKSKRMLSPSKELMQKLILCGIR